MESGVCEARLRRGLLYAILLYFSMTGGYCSLARVSTRQRLGESWEKTRISMAGWCSAWRDGSMRWRLHWRIWFGALTANQIAEGLQFQNRQQPLTTEPQQGICSRPHRETGEWPSMRGHLSEGKQITRKHRQCTVSCCSSIWASLFADSRQAYPSANQLSIVYCLLPTVLLRAYSL